VTGRPKFAVAAWLLALVACAVVIATTRFSADMSAFLPGSPSPTQEILVEQMQHGVASRLILVAIEKAPAPILAELSKSLAQRLRGQDAFSLVSNGDDAGAVGGAPSADTAFVWRNRYLLSPDVTPARFSVAGLHQALESDLRLLASDLGGAVKQSLPADPTGEILALVGEFAGQTQPAHRDGVWFSPDGRRALLVAQTRAAGFDIARAEKALGVLDAAFAAARRATTGAAEARLRATGPAIFAVHTKNEMKQDIARLSLFATLLVSAILLATYRSVRILVLALVPVASGALAGIAAVSLGFGFVHGITLGFGVTLIGEAVDYAIYLFTQTAPGTSADATLPRIWPILRLGVLISVCGFSAMLFSSFTGFAQLGLFSITGLLVAVAVTRFVLPELLPAGFATPRSTAFAPALLVIIRRARILRFVLLAAILGSLALLLLHRGSMWEDDLSSLSPIPAADQQLDRRLRADVGAADVRYLIVASSRNEEGALVASERLAAVLDRLKREHAIDGYDAPSRYLPSAATQRARRDALPDAATLRTRLDAAVKGLPFQPNLFAPFIRDVAATKARPILDRKDLQGTGLALKLDSLLFNRRGAWTALLSLRGVAEPARVRDAVVQAGVPGTSFVDLKAESDRLLEVYRHEALMLALIGSFVIVLLLAASLRSVRRVALVVAPLAASVLLTVALLTAGHGKLSIFNLVGLLLTVAVGSNYCIFFERQRWDERDSERMVASLVLANLCTVIGFGILSFARLPVLHGIGVTVAAGAFFSLVFSAILTSRVREDRRRDVR
jgi:predicted exporter